MGSRFCLLLFGNQGLYTLDEVNPLSNSQRDDKINYDVCLSILLHEMVKFDYTSFTSLFGVVAITVFSAKGQFRLELI